MLTNASAVLSLSVERASAALPVLIRGVVTASEPHWGGRFFIQDSTGGVFVENIGDIRLAPGNPLKGAEKPCRRQIGIEHQRRRGAVVPSPREVATRIAST